jgi:hypothetical protein
VCVCGGGGNHLSAFKRFFVSDLHPPFVSDLHPPFSVRWCHTDADPAADGAGAGAGASAGGVMGSKSKRLSSSLKERIGLVNTRAFMCDALVSTANEYYMTTVRTLTLACVRLHFSTLKTPPCPCL